MGDNILIIAAHSDDQIIGVGGTAAKYAEEGFDVKTIIVTSGEVSHPHFQEEIIIGTREKESLRADKIIGGKGVKFLNLLEKDIGKDSEVKKAKKKLKEVIKKLKPVKIFIHSHDDPHPIHRKVHKMTKQVFEEMNCKSEIYCYDIWNPFKWDKKRHPKLVVDISDTFEKKVKALKAFKSQFNVLGFMNFFALTSMYVKNVINGRKHNTKYVEVFYRLK